MRIVFQNQAVVVADKPSGQTVIPGRGEGGITLQAQLQERIGERLWIVHRIDRDTSGLVILARDAATHRLLCREFENHRVAKTYIARVWAAGPAPIARLWDAPLREFGSGRSAVHPTGKPCRTIVRVLEWRPGVSGLLALRPRTGRRHQLRAHCYHAACPILGDALYGGRDNFLAAKRLLLHHRRLRFSPTLRQTLELPRVFSCEPPARDGFGV